MSTLTRLTYLLCIAFSSLTGCTQQNQIAAVATSGASQAASIPASASEIQREANYLGFCFTVIKPVGDKLWVSSDAASNLTLMPWQHILRVGSCFQRANVKDYDASATYCVQSIVKDGVVFSFEKGRSDGGATVGQVKLKWTPLPAPRAQSREDKYHHDRLISSFSIFNRKANKVRVVVKPSKPLTLRTGISDIGVGYKFNGVEKGRRYNYQLKAIEADGAVMSYKGGAPEKKVTGDVKLKWKP